MFTDAMRLKAQNSRRLKYALKRARKAREDIERAKDILREAGQPVPRERTPVKANGNGNGVDIDAAHPETATPRKGKGKGKGKRKYNRRYDLPYGTQSSIPGRLHACMWVWREDYLKLKAIAQDMEKRHGIKSSPKEMLHQVLNSKR